jgi:ATP phosphoribosyltransferase
VNNASSSTERFLENIFNTEIKKVATENNVRNYEYTTLNPNLSIIQIKPKDIPVLINNNFIDGIVTYEDIIITGILMNYGTLYLNYFFCFFRLFIFYL